MGSNGRTTAAVTTSASAPRSTWSAAGSYFEACNCEAICPCRRVGSSDGGSSTDGVCDFALSWHLEEGRAGVTDLRGMDVVLAGRYVDDAALADGRELGSWEVALYVDERADQTQAAVLESIFLGRSGGTPLTNFAGAIGTVHVVRRAAIALVHEPRRKRIEVTDHVRVVGRARVPTTERVSCGIPGHDRPGEEWTAEGMAVEEIGLRWQVVGKCGFATTFSYRSTDG